MKNLIIFILLAIPQFTFSQEREVYIMQVKVLDIHIKPLINSRVMDQLKKGDQVVILSEVDDWYEIKVDNKTGYIQGPTLSQKEFWTKKIDKSSSFANCENITPKYDYDLNNFLELQVGSNTDAVVKLMKVDGSGEMCYRIAHLLAGSVFKIRNIPQGEYYLKIAYGSKWKQGVINGICYGKFTLNPVYERGAEVFDFSVVKTEKGYQVPSYSVSVDVLSSEQEIDDLNKISEEEFNN
jgi:uncharacterized protein YgiM (DUF1202 family)